VKVFLGHPALRRIEEAEAWLVREAKSNGRREVATALSDLYPKRFADALAEGTQTLAQLTREQRAALAERLTRLPLPVSGDRGYSYAETTAGGVDLREIDAHTMESRAVPGLHLCGEMLDCDGRIGGFSFQWAWASGHLAGRGSVSMA
jgi:predicted flavoprotein YhiN